MNQLRIIAGKWRRRKIQFAKEPNIRPTMDSIRETLFNWLQSHIEKANCLDLFTGSGALGIEALSRGAAHVTFMDKSAGVIQTIKDQLHKLDCHQFTAVRTPLPNGIFKLTNVAFDIVFLDPPFNSELLNECIAALASQAICKDGTLIYIEADRGQEINLPEKWQVQRHKTTKRIQYLLVECVK